MSDVVDRAAEAIEWHFTDSDEHSGCALRCGWGGQDDLSRAEHLAQALDGSGLLATPERDAEQREIGAVAVTDLIRASAIGSRARGDSDRERTLLDLLALIEMTKP